MDIRQTLQAAAADPRFQQALQAAQQELGDASPEQLSELIKLIEFALQSPKDYPEIRAAAIADKMVDPEDLPEQFDPTMLASVLSRTPSDSVFPACDPRSNPAQKALPAPVRMMHRTSGFLSASKNF